MVIRAALFLLAVLMTQVVRASECDGLVAELQTMKKAQSQIMTSLATNHETFAVTIEEFTSELKMSKKTAPTKAITAIDESAQAFRSRGVQAKRLADRFDSATDDLIGRIAQCLKK